MPSKPTFTPGERRLLDGRPLDEARSPGEVLSGVSALMRESGREAVVAVVILLAVLMGVVGLLPGGMGFPVVGPVLLLSMSVTFATSAALACRSRQTMVRALAELRMRIGAPVDPQAPWTSLGAEPPPGEDALWREVRRLIGAAWLCAELAWRAVVWALVTGVIFIFWSIARLGG